MRTYQLVLLHRGPAASAEKTPEAERLQAGHRARMVELWEQGVLAGAGPVLDDGDLRGVFIMTAASLDVARALVAEDPAVKAGRLRAEVLEWYGPVGIGEAYRARRKADPSAADVMVRYQFGFLARGPAYTTEETPALLDLHKAHLAHLSGMARAGKLAAAGPLSGSDRLAGVLVFAMERTEDAVALASEDPGVKSGRFLVELHPWTVAEGVVPAMPAW
jgi:uncharacterized protein YciI